MSHPPPTPAEIIVIALGSAAGVTLLEQSLVLSILAIGVTVGIYGLVAGIVKIDDAGFASDGARK